MRDWLGRLIALAAGLGAVALVLGFVNSPVAAAIFLFLACLAVAAIHYRNQSRLARWIADPRPEDVPDISGSWGEIFARLYKHVKLERQSQAGLAAALLRFAWPPRRCPTG